MNPAHAFISQQQMLPQLYVCINWIDNRYCSAGWNNARAATGTPQPPFSKWNMDDAAFHVDYVNMKKKRDQQFQELEKIYDKCLRMQFALARDQLDLINLWKSAEMLKEKEASLTASCQEELEAFTRKQDWFIV